MSALESFVGSLLSPSLCPSLPPFLPPSVLSSPPCLLHSPIRLLPFTALSGGASLCSNPAAPPPPPSLPPSPSQHLDNRPSLPFFTFSNTYFLPIPSLMHLSFLVLFLIHLNSSYLTHHLPCLPPLSSLSLLPACLCPAQPGARGDPPRIHHHLDYTAENPVNADQRATPSAKSPPAALSCPRPKHTPPITHSGGRGEEATHLVS